MEDAEEDGDFEDAECDVLVEMEIVVSCICGERLEEAGEYVWAILHVRGVARACSAWKWRGDVMKSRG